MPIFTVPLAWFPQGTLIDFQVGVNAYLYGTRFMSYLALEYSPQHVIEWLKREEDSKRYYASQFKLVFGKPLEDAWEDWIDWEHEFQQANLDSVQKFPVTPTTPLTKGGAGFDIAIILRPRQQHNDRCIPNTGNCGTLGCFVFR